MENLEKLYKKYLDYIADDSGIDYSNPDTVINQLVDISIIHSLRGEMISEPGGDFSTIRELTIDEFKNKIEIDPLFIEKISK